MLRLVNHRRLNDLRLTSLSLVELHTLVIELIRCLLLGMHFVHGGLQVTTFFYLCLFISCSGALLRGLDHFADALSDDWLIDNLNARLILTIYLLYLALLVVDVDGRDGGFVLGRGRGVVWGGVTAHCRLPILDVKTEFIHSSMSVVSLLD